MSGFLPYLRRLSRINPIDYQDADTQNHLEALAGPLDDIQERARAAMLARLLVFAAEDALELTGHERGLIRYPGEYLEAFRHRLLKAWEFWDQAGTLPGMTAALDHLGYGVRIGTLDGNWVSGIFKTVAGGVVLTQAGGSEPRPSSVSFTIDADAFTLPTLITPADYTYYALPPTKIIEHYHEDRTIWAEFSLYITPTEAAFTADAWDDGNRWDDGSLWDLSIPQTEVDRIRAILNEIKPAHARLRGIYLVSHFETDYWDDGSHWDDSSVWDAGAPTVLYLRPGA